jgi:hypothetical protein
MKKFFREIEEQYVWLWWWLLDQGMIIATILVNTFFISIFALVMALLVLFLKFYGRH